MKRITIIFALLIYTAAKIYGQGAGPDQVIHLNDTVHMAATVTGGNWYIMYDGPNIGSYPNVVIDSPNSPTTSISGFTELGVYKCKWTATDSMFIYVDSLATIPTPYLQGNCANGRSIEVYDPTIMRCTLYNNGMPVDSVSYPEPQILQRLFPPCYKLAIDGVGNKYTYIDYKIVEFPVGINTVPITVAGGNGPGAALNQFSYNVQDIMIDHSDNIYVADYNNYRVLKFPAGSTSATNGIVVAGGNGSGNALNQIQPTGLCMDGLGNIYVSDSYSHRVLWFPAGSTSATNGVVVAGGNGPGSAANQLNFPCGIGLDSHGALYVMDYNNQRVQKFPSGSTSSTSGLTIAGGNGVGSAANQFSSARNIIIDAKDNIYVADASNYRIQMFAANSIGANGVTIAGLYGFGTSPRQLGAVDGIALDANDNLYVIDDYYSYTGRIIKYAVRDTIRFNTQTAGNYTMTIETLSGAQSAMSAAVSLSPCPLDTVWPGDADANRQVSISDLLLIGLAYDSTGPARSAQGIVWQGDEVYSWQHAFQTFAAGVNFDHADCNGDGIINADDTLAILTNFSLTHAKTSGTQPYRAGMPILKAQLSADTLYAGDTLTVTFILGDNALPASNIYGLAFTYNFDPTVVDSPFTTMSFGSSWIGNADKISISKTLNNAGQIKAALTRIDHTTRSGYGPIASASFRITTDNISGKDYSFYANMGYVSDIVAIDDQGNLIQLNAGADTSQVGYEPNGIPEAANANIALYPNPAAGKVSITADDMITAVSITDITGLEVYRAATKSGNSITVDLPATVASGIYFVHVKTMHTSGIAKLSVIR